MSLTVFYREELILYGSCQNYHLTVQNFFHTVAGTKCHAAEKDGMTTVNIYFISRQDKNKDNSPPLSFAGSSHGPVNTLASLWRQHQSSVSTPQLKYYCWPTDALNIHWYFIYLSQTGSKWREICPSWEIHWVRHLSAVSSLRMKYFTEILIINR